ncbi:Acyl-CoA dehydrogenase [hydrothermal vent metagenome]|uniref:Acyl-coenzyme A dehydrogenase n=1 Tax=hydrothermal vent metagenome TaxID=652676 RepID=A0A3B1CP10_9ZZZZ
MAYLLWPFALLALVWALAFWRAPLAVSTAIFAVVLAGWSYLGIASIFIIILAWALFLLVAIPLNVRSLRKKFITRKIFALFKKIAPVMSNTEKEALEAGSVWWDGELFSGKPDWKKLLAYKAPALTKKEEEYLDGPVEQLCKMLDDWKITNDLRDLPPEAWSFIKENRFFGMIIPEKYGGLGFSALAHSAVVMKIASRSMAGAVTVMVPNSLGPAELLMHYGTDEQKNRYLPSLASGKDIPCFALTSPEAGSDAASMPDRGVVVKEQYQGEETLGIRANFDKRYITLSPVSTVIGLAFKLYDPDKLLGDKEDIGITVALLPSDTPGVDISRRHDPLGVAFMNGCVTGENVFIPMDWLVGGRKMAGRGWKMLMERLAIGRAVSLPAVSVAGAKYASRVTGAYATVRKQFKMSIGKFEGVEEKLSNIAGNAYLMEAARTMTVGAVDQGERPSVISAMMKYNLTEKLRFVINEAMDVHAGSGIILGPRNAMGLDYMALPISITVEGANILTRSLIVFGQGAIRCHPHVLDELESVSDPDTKSGLDKFDKALFGHIGFVISNAVRSLSLGLTASRLAVVPRGPGGQASRYLQKLTRMSAAFALLADTAMLTLGSSLKKKERLSARFADSLSQMYMISATIKRFEDDGRPKEDIPLMNWACEEGLYVIQERLSEIIDNLPLRPAAWIMRFLIFPLGRRDKKPGDRLSHKVADLILKPSSARDRLTAGIFAPNDPDDPVGRVEDAFEKVIKAEPVEKRVRELLKAGKLSSITPEEQVEEALKSGDIIEEEAEAMRKALSARKEVITVDDFGPDYWKKAEER